MGLNLIFIRATLFTDRIVTFTTATHLSQRSAIVTGKFFQFRFKLDRDALIALRCQPFRG